MSKVTNNLVWDGKPGHYEVYYVTATDPVTGVGLWIRYTLLAPLPESGQAASCSLWFVAMSPGSERPLFAAKESYSIDQLSSDSSPFKLTVNGSSMTDTSMQGSIDGRASWDISWQPKLKGYTHVDPLLAKLKVAKTTLTLPHPDIEISGTVTFDGRTIQLDSVPAGQAHLWGSKHAPRWCWLHCSDFAHADGSPVAAGTFIDGVSLYLDRFGAERGPVTPVVGRFDGADFISTKPMRIVSNRSRFDLNEWEFELRARNRRITALVSMRSEDAVGVTYTDPDGQLAYCYNSEVATARFQLWERNLQGGGWRHIDELVADRCAHYEYAVREPLPNVELMV